MSEQVTIGLSNLDEARFGVRTAKGSVKSAAAVPQLLDFCYDNGVELAIVRCPTTEIKTAQRLESEGFFLTDTLLYFRYDVAKIPLLEPPASITIRQIHLGEEDAVGHVAADAFHNYRSHYHNDPYLDQTKCDEVYIDWAIRSCLAVSENAQVFVAVDDGKIVGFTTPRIESPDEATFWLTGIARAAQGRGIYALMETRGIAWLREKGIRWVINSTQIANHSMQKAYTHLGGMPAHSDYTFHKWFTKT